MLNSLLPVRTGGELQYWLNLILIKPVPNLRKMSQVDSQLTILPERDRARQC
jgi:hypothetical protein